MFKAAYLAVIAHDGRDVGESEDAVLGLPEQITACLFDLDGVLTDTASVHKKAWKAMFDDYLRRRAERTGEPFAAFDIGGDYLNYVDGKRRQDGVRSFLASRGIELPEGTPDDAADADTIEGLGNRKNARFHQALQQDGVEVFEDRGAIWRLSHRPVCAGPWCRRAPTPRRSSRSPDWTHSSSSGWTG